MALATIDQLATFMGRTFDTVDDQARADMLLAGASARVESYTGRSFSVQSRTATLSVAYGRVKLPTGPVVSVSSVTDLGGNTVDFTWTSGRTVTVSATCGSVTVDYMSGYTTPPDDVVAVVCQMAGRAWGLLPAEASVTQESIMSFSQSFGAVGGAGPVGLLVEERATLDAYRRTGVGTIQLGSWTTS